MGIGGEIGFDEGGVLQALFARPVWSQETEHFKYNKQGLVIKRWTTKFDMSMGDALVPLVLAGILSLGALYPGLPQAATTGGVDPSGNCNWGMFINLYGNLLGPVLYANCIRNRKNK
ncbi:unnamed protein product [marine sediment metagenome]|uniref:Uncharacterized protein n=1 Tax=marine sediment metagenome TaxID=412755 RepID=X0ZXA1_9ZZZZ